MHQEIQETDDRYRIFFENSKDAMLIIKNNVFIDCNNAAVQMLGYDCKKEFLHQSPSTLSPEFQIDGISSKDKADAMIEIATKNKSHIFEWTHIKKNGVEFPVEVSLTVIEEGANIIINTIWRDISKRKKVEKELLRMHKQKSLEVLAGGIAHDFNNVLIGIYGNISLAKCEIMENTLSFDYLTAAEKSIESARNLTYQLVNLSKGIQLSKENVQLDDMLQKIINFNLISDNIKPKISSCYGLWPVIVDKGKIQQVITNLIINAVQAMPNGGVIYFYLQNQKISTESNISLTPGDYVKLTIKDEGIGILNEHLENIFDPYFTTKKSGNGLGLAMVHSIIDKHNGLIEVTSELGKGTEFNMYLPADS